MKWKINTFSLFKETNKLCRENKLKKWNEK